MIFFDCDNTLLDNDAVEADLYRHLDAHFGPDGARRYRACFEALRTELGYADYLGAVQRFRDPATSDSRFFELSRFLLEYPFPARLYPGALDVIAACATLGPVAILSDGDAVFQPHKLRRSGLWDAVGGQVLIYLHKERDLGEVATKYPARHYVMVDDKPRVLAAMKEIWGSRLTTVFPRQGHYAADASALAQYPPADVTVERIGDLLKLDLERILRGTDVP